ncbi:MAG TPA: XdhC family protein [Candidatus Kapabacteria bacterium]|nr:XdhC family protein [Candidatus Kapabacteria bacterium]
MAISIFNEASTAIEKGVPFTLGIISGVKGSSPQKQGAKALFFEDGRIVGTLGGGCLEAEVRKRSLEALRTKAPTQFDLVLDHDFGWDDGLICGGKVSCLLLPDPVQAPTVFQQLAKRDVVRTWGVTTQHQVVLTDDPNAKLLYRETILPPECLWIAGAGHIGRAVAPLAELVDFQVTVFDDRPAMADPQFFPACTQLRVSSNWEELLLERFPSVPTLGLVLTRGHQHDALVLSKWVHKPFAFLGMIGSRRKKTVIFEQFIAEGLATKEQLDRVSCPVGLPIGDVSVQEIALSITAQLVQNRSERRISYEAARNIRSPSLIKARVA